MSALPASRCLLVPSPPAQALARLREHMDALHPWQGGGVEFGRRPFLGEVKGAGFRIRTTSLRRDGAVAFLVGWVEAAPQGARIRVHIERPTGFLRTLPVAALGPALLFGVGGHLAAPALVDGALARAALTVAFALLGLLIAAALVAVVIGGIRRDAARLHSFLQNAFPDCGEETRPTPVLPESH